MTAVAQEERELLPRASGARVRATVGELLRPHRGLLVAGFGILVASTAIGLLIAPLLGYVVDLVVDGRPPDAITTPVVLLVAVAVAQGMTGAAGVSLIARLGEGVLATLRERFVERAVHLPLERVEAAGSGDLSSRVTNDVSVIAEAVRRALPELARSALTIVLTLVGLAVLDWRFMLAALLAAPIQINTVRWYLRNAPQVYTAHRVAVGAQQQQLLDTVGGAGTVRALGLADEHVARVTRRSLSAVDLALRGIRLLTRFYARLNLAEYIGLTAVLVTGFLLVRGGHASIGTATAAALYFHSLFTPLNLALGLVDDAQSALVSLARLVGVTDLAHEAPAAAPARPESAGVPVKLAGVGHAYRPGHPVLHGVDLEIAAGERVALVGASGAGKTTLAKLIAGVHRPTAGSISLGGVEPGDGRTAALITQEVHVFAGTLADDLRLARPDATDEELSAALDRVGALDWVRALPEGPRTVVGEGGHRLTVAQAQQLALARLVLADPPVAVLDEATAEAGSAGARELELAADRALAGRTALIVAHRLTQAAAADRVVVLDAGRVVESGAHDELAARPDGRYAALWRAWSDTRRDEG
ncbi:ABC transporter ATP-binding protein [Actinomadura craniellae]|uniref:ABC transporter ATP-binding protein n=1 Tax=Actinomadura craniellae TaxID=2231787 RepID=A0A365HA90_9ACTN|nr:ABC transporter ATP-binding protein [Actinomadura craniellae]RAY16064.1 ABC transporter ATP-binding protein [Actinomadura craniellae]